MRNTGITMAMSVSDRKESSGHEVGTYALSTTPTIVDTYQLDHSVTPVPRKYQWRRVASALPACVVATRRFMAAKVPSVSR